MAEYTPCTKPDPTAQKAIGNVMRETKCHGMGHN